MSTNSLPNGRKQDSIDFQRQLTIKGFTKGTSLPQTETMERYVPRAITNAFTNLSVDPYAPDFGRHRSYSRMVYLPWRDSLDWLPTVDHAGRPHSPYDQGRFNGEFQQMRYFPAIDGEAENFDFVERLVRADLAILASLETFRHWPVYVGVHFIRLLVERGREKAGTTPDCLHQDGGADMFTFVHLIGLANATGGDTLVAPPACSGMSPADVPDDSRLAHFRLERPLDWYAVNDQMVSHYAAPIRAEDRRAPAATRDVILLGISPYKPIFF